MRRRGQGRIGAVATVALTALALGAAELGSLASPAMAAPAHGPRPFAKAYQETVAQKSSDVSLAINESVAGQSVKITATGAFDWEHNQGNLMLNIDLGTGTPETLEEVLANGQVYVELPAAERSALGGKPWIEVPVGTSGSSGLSGENPASALALLQANTTGLRKVGPATVQGIPTTEYRAKVNPAKAAAKSSPELRKVLQQALSQFSGLHSVPLQVWIDGQNRIRQMKESFTLNPNPGSAAASGGPVHVVTTVDLTNYGVPVSVTVPPPDQVSHESLSQLGAAAGGAGTTS